MDADARSAKTQKELDQLAAFVFRWRWPLTILPAVAIASEVYDLYTKRLEFLKAVMTGSLLNGTFYHAFGNNMISIIGFLLMMFNIRFEVNRHRLLLAQAELKHTPASPDAWPPTPRI